MCVCLKPFWAGGSRLCSDVIGAAGWGDMGLEFGRGPDSISPQNVPDQYVCDCHRLPVCLSVCQPLSSLGMVSGSGHRLNALSVIH